MKNLFQYLQYVIIATIFGCGGDIDQTIKTEFPDLMTITLENNSELSRIDEAVFLDVKLLKEKNPDFNPKAFVVLDAGKELPGQADDLNADSNPDQIIFICDFDPNKKEN